MIFEGSFVQGVPNIFSLLLRSFHKAFGVWYCQSIRLRWLGSVSLLFVFVLRSDDKDKHIFVLFIFIYWREVCRLSDSTHLLIYVFHPETIVCCTIPQWSVCISIESTRCIVFEHHQYTLQIWPTQSRPMPRGQCLKWTNNRTSIYSPFSDSINNNAPSITKERTNEQFFWIRFRVVACTRCLIRGECVSVFDAVNKLSPIYHM